MINVQSNFKVLYTNAQSLINKIDELRCTACDLKPDIICVVETWTNSSHTNAYLQINGFNIVCHYDRTDTTKGVGGGLLIYVNDKLCAPESFHPSFKEYNQCCSISLPLKHSKAIELCLVYRPHNLYDSVEVADNNKLLCGILHSISKPCVLIGDFNFSDISWDRLHGKPHSLEFIGAIQDNFFTQHVTFPTHSSGTTPDLVLASNPNLIIDVKDDGKLGASDHSIISVVINGELELNDSIEYVPDWKKINIDGMKNDLSNIDWNTELGSLNADDSWIQFKAIIDKIQNDNVPQKKRRVRNRPLWMKPNIMRTIRKKRRLWKTYSKSREYQDLLLYKVMMKSVQKAVRSAKRKFEIKLARNVKKNPKDFYSYMKSKTGNKESVGPLKQGDDIISDDQEIAEHLNTFFSSVFTTESMHDLPQPDITYFGSSPLSDCEITPEKVKQKLDNLRQSAAPGPDKLFPRILKMISSQIMLPLAVIYNKSFNEGCVPSEWKNANVTPIFKKGSKTDPGNYRPVSLTSVICKVMESILKDSLMLHLTSNNILKISQHGFMKGKSCLTNLLEYLEVLTKLVDEGHSVDVIYLDFSKAFDKVPHERLLSKMKSAGIDGNFLAWIRDWLSNRKQRVVLNGLSSTWKSVMSGVPQGSVLGPVLFLIYVNDIDNALSTVLSVIFKFADDAKLLHVVENVTHQENFQQDLDHLQLWAVEWQMLFNLDKCKVMHFGKKNLNFDYKIGDTILKVTDIEKDLGVHIHQSLKPSAQCAQAVAKGNQVLGQMARSFTYRDKFVWINLYKMHVRTHLEYAVQSWCPWTQADVNSLEAVQKRAVNMTTGLKGRTYEEKLHECKLTTLQDRRIRGDLIQVWKLLHGKQDVDASIWFHSSLANVRDTRRSAEYMLVKPRFNGDIRKNFFSVRVIDRWNILPYNVKCVDSIDIFKERYDKLF